MHRFIPFVLLISLTVGACRQTPVEPEPLNFDTDPRILRGTWVGESEDGHSLVLEAKAGLPSQDGYEVSGTFRLDNEVPVEFSGGVRVPVTQTSTALSPQLSPVCGGTFFAFSEDSAWEFCGDAPEGLPPRFETSALTPSCTRRSFQLFHD